MADTVSPKERRQLTTKCQLTCAAQGWYVTAPDYKAGPYGNLLQALDAMQSYVRSRMPAMSTPGDCVTFSVLIDSA